MATYSWRERPLTDQPMARVVEIEYGDGKIRYAVETYISVTHANYESKEKWLEQQKFKKREDAEKSAEKLANWMLSQAVKERRITNQEPTHE